MAVLVAAIASAGPGLERAAGDLDEHEYDLSLPDPRGANGEVGPVGQTTTDDSALEESTTTPEEVSGAPAPAESVEETPTGEPAADQSTKSESRPDGARYPRGETYALGSAKQASAGLTDTPSGDGKPGLAMAIIAAIGGLVVGIGAWRMRTRDTIARR